MESLAFSPDGKKLAAGGSDKTICFFDLASGACTQTLRGKHEGPVATLAFAPDGKRLLSAATHNIHMWSLTTGKEEQVWTPCVIGMKPGETLEEANLREGMMPINIMQVTCVAWSPDGKTIATSGNNGNIRVTDSQGKQLRNFNISYPLSLQTQVGLTFMTFTPDNRCILYTGIDKNGAGTAGILDLETGKHRVEFSGHNDALLVGGYMAPGDGTNIRVNLVHGYITPPARAGHLSADGKWAISASGTRSEVSIWRTDDGSLVQQFNGRGKELCASPGAMTASRSPGATRCMAKTECPGPCNEPSPSTSSSLPTRRPR